MTQFLWENIFKRDQKNQGAFSVLGGCPLFTDLNRHEMRLLENTVHVRQYQSGEFIFRQDEVGVGMYVIAEGSVEIYIEEAVRKDDEETKSARRSIVRLKKGDFFGELALAELQGRRTATAQASSEATLIGFFQPDLQEICDRSPQTGVKILNQLCQVLGRRLRETSGKITEMKKQLDKIKANK